MLHVPGMQNSFGVLRYSSCEDIDSQLKMIRGLDVSTFDLRYRQTCMLTTGSWHQHVNIKGTPDSEPLIRCS